MDNFYRRTLILLCIAIGLSLAINAYAVYKSYLKSDLLPQSDSDTPWTLRTLSDQIKGGSSTIKIAESKQEIRYTYQIDDQIRYPQVFTIFDFYDDIHSSETVDISRYSTFLLKIQCSQANVMTFHLHTFDERATVPDDFFSYKISEIDFACSTQSTVKNFDIKHLNVALWWPKNYRQSAGDKEYRLDKTHAISIDNDERGPTNTPINVQIAEAALYGRNYRSIWVGASLTLCLWLALVVYIFRAYKQYLIIDIKSKINTNKRFFAYQKLAIEPHRDKEKVRLLQFLNEEFKNPEISLGFVEERIGLNRNKINDLLKEELNSTFTHYLNNLRLIEAANKLSEASDENISEIAYSVGYNSSSYFNKLFKTRYGCTPRKFSRIQSKNKTSIENG